MKYILSVCLLFLALGIPTVNIKHNLLLPKLDTDTIQSSLFFNPASIVLYGIQYDIRLGTEISNPEQFKKVLEVLNHSTKRDRIIFHLTGFGGKSQTLYQLINVVQISKAYITMVVEAPVYSAHAYLAISGDKLIMLPYSSLMFHSSSALGESCESQKGQLDRLQDAEKKCEQFIQNELTLSAYMVSNSSFLTTEEKSQINAGYDVYITSWEYNKRVQK